MTYHPGRKRRHVPHSRPASLSSEESRRRPDSKTLAAVRKRKIVGSVSGRRHSANIAIDRPKTASRSRPPATSRPFGNGCKGPSAPRFAAYFGCFPGFRSARPQHLPVDSRPIPDRRLAETSGRGPSEAAWPTARTRRMFPSSHRPAPEDRRNACEETGRSPTRRKTARALLAPTANERRVPAVKQAPSLGSVVRDGLKTKYRCGIRNC